MSRTGNRLSNISSSSVQYGVINRQPAVNRVVDRTGRTSASFPDSPLITVKPLRYNTHLNRQITRIQMAEGFLNQVEDSVINLKYAISHRSGQSEINTHADVLDRLLSARRKYSAGTVDRQLRVSVDDEARVRFQLDDYLKILSDPRPEVLTFSLAGAKREISAVVLPADNTVNNNLLRLNRGLGRWGISATLQQHEVQFEVSERNWERVSQQLSIKGEGERFPAGLFYPVKPQAEPALEDHIQQFKRFPSRGSKLLPQLEMALNNLTSQRRVIFQKRSRIDERIASMATFDNDQAVKDSVKMMARLLRGGSFSHINQALQAQANVPVSRVRNVLSYADQNLI